MGAEFADNATAVGGAAQTWRQLRFEVDGLRLVGVLEHSGLGFSFENVNHVYGADGSGEPIKVTQGRKKPGEVSIKVLPGTYAILSARITGRLFRYQVVNVGAGLEPTTTDQMLDCTLTGVEKGTNNDSGTPNDYTIKFTGRKVDLAKGSQ